MALALVDRVADLAGCLVDAVMGVDLLVTLDLASVFLVAEVVGMEGLAVVRRLGGSVMVD